MYMEIILEISLDKLSNLSLLVSGLTYFHHLSQFLQVSGDDIEER